MDIENSISVGERVDVFWETVPALFSCEVLSVPSRPNFIWVLKGMDGKIHYIKNYCRISRH